MNAFKSPCLNCEKRTINCHSSCEDYKKYKDNLSELKELKRKQSVYEEYVYNRAEKYRK